MFQAAHQVLRSELDRPDLAQVREQIIELFNQDAEQFNREVSVVRSHKLLCAPRSDCAILTPLRPFLTPPITA